MLLREAASHKLARNRPHLGRSPRLPGPRLSVDEGDLAVEAWATLYQHGLDRARLGWPLDLVRVKVGVWVSIGVGRWG